MELGSLSGVEPVHAATAMIAIFTAFLAWAIWAVHNHFFTKPLKIIRKLKAQGIPGYPFRPFVGQLKEMIEIRNKREKDPTYAAATSPVQFTVDSRAAFSNGPPNPDSSSEKSSPPSALAPAWFFSLGPTVRVVLHDPVLVRQVYVANIPCFQKSPLLQKLRCVGQGLLSASGPLWSWQRRLINPAFSHKEIKRLFPTMVQCTEDAMTKLEKRVKVDPGQAVNAESEFSRLTLDIICRCAFGSQLEELFGEQMMDTFMTAFVESLTSGIRVLQYMFIFPYFRWLPLQINRRLLKAENVIIDAMEKIINVRMEKHQEKMRVRQRVGDADAGESSRTDLLELMMSATEGVGALPREGGEEASDRTVEERQAERRFGRVLSPKLLMENSMTFLLAGHETTAQLLTWTSLLLSQHPEWHQKATSEVDALFAANGGVSPSMEQLGDLKVVSWILQEALRLYPPASAVGASCIQTVKLSDSLTLPAGADIIIPISAIHTDKDLWGEDAEEFKPDRFANGASKAAKSPHAFMPFSLGPRNCIGQNFALAEAKVILAHLLRRFTWELSEKYVHHPDLAFTLRPKKGMPIVLTTRNV